MNDLPVVQECLIEILRALPRQPRRLRLSAGEVTVELEWPTADSPAGGDVTVGGAVAGNGAAVSGAAGPAANGGAGADPVGTVPDLVCSPSVGTFYRSPEPGAPPFVAEGDLVRPGQQVGIVEVMKLMLPVETAKAGRVAKILKADGAPVEYGEPLLEIAGPGEADGG